MAKLNKKDQMKHLLSVHKYLQKAHEEIQKADGLEGYTYEDMSQIDLKIHVFSVIRVVENSIVSLEHNMNKGKK